MTENVLGFSRVGLEKKESHPNRANHNARALLCCGKVSETRKYLFRVESHLEIQVDDDCRSASRLEIEIRRRGSP
jgi:hypothetical protein